MYTYLKEIYETTKKESYLTNAVKKKYITAEEKAEIITAVA